MDLIPKEELTRLKSADSVKKVADQAVSILERESVAHLINTAANCGQHSVVCNHQLSESILKELKRNGYKVVHNPHSADPTKCYLISGF